MLYAPLIKDSTVQTLYTFYLSLEDTRILTDYPSGAKVDQPFPYDSIRYLFRFINESTKDEIYAYPKTFDRTNYGSREQDVFDINESTYDIYTGKIFLKPFGFWKYEVYEISWFDGSSALTPSLTASTAVSSLALDEVGNSQNRGLVANGILLADSEADFQTTKPTYQPEVQYREKAGRVINIKITSGGAGYSVAPTISFSDVIDPNNTNTAPTKQATATCTISGGVINAVTITDNGAGYHYVPKIVLTGGSPSTAAVLEVELSQDEDNYIYY